MPTDAEVYGYGTLANVLCCLCSLAGAFVLPCARKHHGAFHVVMSVFMGLAVGCLAADALLHLIPEALGLHSHDDDEHVNHTDHDHHEEEDHDDDGELKVEPFVWYGLVIVAGIYLFYLVEIFMASLQHKGKQRRTSDVMGNIGNGFTDQKPESFRKIDESQTSTGFESQMEINQGHLTDSKGIEPVVFMIIIGDAIHNFTDGLAVAASFNKGIMEGISTSLAIVCHELPQELGDFAVLMKNGLSFKKALFFNLLSSLTALAGFYIGVSLSRDAFASQWIFAVAAGTFLYISLADMIPQLIQSGAGRFRTILYHNIGILIGILIILLLSVFEDKIDLSSE